MHFIFFVSLLSVCSAIEASDTAQTRPPLSLSTGLSGNLVSSFTGVNALLHVSGIGATALIIRTGTDYRVQRFFNEREALSNAFIPVALTGFLGPVGLSLGSYYYGKRKGDAETFGAGCALIQANAISFAYTSLIKAVTGRPNPDTAINPDMRELSRTFRFGFMRGGIFWGWPSGHTAATTATLSCLSAYYPDKTWLAVGGAVWTAYTVAGVAAVGRGHMHWLSDGISAVLMNYAIGNTVGAAFRRRVNGEKEAVSGPRLRFAPLIAGDYRGAEVRLKL